MYSVTMTSNPELRSNKSKLNYTHSHQKNMFRQTGFH